MSEVALGPLIHVVVRATKGVGTIWFAYAFADIARISLPQAIGTHNA
jgi:hypothetical protein